MKSSISNYEIFEYNLSAFLSASRSILLYAFEEVKRNGNIKWYNSFRSSSPVIEFFRVKRNTEVHIIPIKTIQRHEFATSLSPTLSVTIGILDNNGNIKEKISTVKHLANTKENNNESEYKMTFHFDDWNGNENGLELCEKYLNELSNFLNEGINNKYITG